MKEKDFFQVVPMLPLSPEREEFYTLSDQIITLYEQKRISFDQMIDEMDKALQNYKAAKD